MTTFTHDVRVAVRSLRKTPAFSLIVIATLALGIGANAAIFSVLNAVLLRPLPYPEPERVMTLWTDNRLQARPEDVTSYPNFADWRAQSRSFAEMAGWTTGARTLTGSGDPEQIAGANVFPTFFQVFDVRAAAGRTFALEDMTEDRKVVIVSDGFARRHFAGDRAALGQTVVLNGVSHEVVGVMPRSFVFPSPTTVMWLPFPAGFARQSRRAHWMSVVGRLKPEVSLEQARSEMAVLASQLEAGFPKENEGLGVRVIPLQEHMVGDIRPALVVLMAAVGFVLLIACANVANLTLARSATRSREIAVRAALGAGRGRIVRQFVTESALLAILGGVVGLVLAKWGVDLLVALAPAGLPRLEDIQVDGRIVAVTLLASIVTAFLFGLPSALRASTVRLGEMLSEGSRSMAGGKAGTRVRRTLVVAEIALALVLLIGAGLLLASFRQLGQVDTGFRSEGVLTARISLPAARYPDAPAARSFFTELTDRVSAIPGVRAVGLASSLPFNTNVISANVVVEGRPPVASIDEREVRRVTVSPEYFETMGIRLLAGRHLSRLDPPGAPSVIVINEAMKRIHFLGEDPVGRTIRWGNTPAGGPQLTIVGVVADVKQDAIEQEVVPEAYFSYLQTLPHALSLVLRADRDPLTLVPSIRSVMQTLDRELPLAGVSTMAALEDASVATRRFNMLLLGTFSALAVALALVGIYGLMSYSVTERYREIGIRKALGAPEGHVLRLVLREALVLTTIGIALGVLLSFGATRVMQTMLFGVGATDPLTFTATAALLIAVALMSSFVPAWRAAAVDPVAALRKD